MTVGASSRPAGAGRARYGDPGEAASSTPCGGRPATTSGDRRGRARRGTGGRRAARPAGAAISTGAPGSDAGSGSRAIPGAAPRRAPRGTPSRRAPRPLRRFGPKDSVLDALPAAQAIGFRDALDDPPQADSPVRGPRAAGPGTLGAPRAESWSSGVCWGGPGGRGTFRRGPGSGARVFIDSAGSHPPARIVVAAAES